MSHPFEILLRSAEGSGICRGFAERTSGHWEGVGKPEGICRAAGESASQGGNWRVTMVMKSQSDDFGTVREQRVNTQQQIRNSIPCPMVAFCSTHTRFTANPFSKRQRRQPPPFKPMGKHLSKTRPSFSISHLIFRFLFTKYKPHSIHYSSALSNTNTCGRHHVFLTFIPCLSLFSLFLIAVRIKYDCEHSLFRLAGPGKWSGYTCCSGRSLLCCLGMNPIHNARL